MPSFLSKVLFALALVIGVSPAAEAATVTIDFSSINPGPSDTAVVSIGSPFVEDGFQIAGSGFSSVVRFRPDGSERATFQGSAGLFSGTRAPMVLTNVGGARLNLFSVDFAHSNNPAIAKSLVVSGLTADGLTVSQTFVLALGATNCNDPSCFPGYATGILGPQFRNLVSASFTAQSEFSSVLIDNIVVSRVPLPASLPLLAGALALTAALALRRRAV